MEREGQGEAVADPRVHCGLLPLHVRASGNPYQRSTSHRLRANAAIPAMAATMAATEAARWTVSQAAAPACRASRPSQQQNRPRSRDQRT